MRQNPLELLGQLVSVIQTEAEDGGREGRGRETLEV